MGIIGASALSSTTNDQRVEWRETLAGQWLRWATVRRYALAGVLISLGYTVTVVVLVDWLRYFGPQGASAASLLVWTILSYFVHRTFTFRSDADDRVAVPRFAAIFIARLAVSTAIVHLAVAGIRTHYLVGVLLNWVVLPAVSYGLMKFWVFRNRNH